MQKFHGLDRDDSKIKKFEAHMGISLKNQSVEFQFFGNDELYVAYKTSTNNSLLITPGAKEIVSFAGPGAIPIPGFSINRDISTGVFNFSFNLNFASSTSFDKLIKEGEIFWIIRIWELQKEEKYWSIICSDKRWLVTCSSNHRFGNYLSDAYR